MSRYLSFITVTLGATAAVVGSVIILRGAITQQGVKPVIAGSSLILGGIGLQALALNQLAKILTEELTDRLLYSKGLSIPTACRGCNYFHGEQYRGVTLICAIHPYGVESENCPDHSSKS